MAVPKTVGLETEYGIVHRGASEPNPISASSLLINAYLIAAQPSSPVTPGRGAVNWDFTEERPGHDARGGAPADALAPEIETHLVNAVLTNGARYYVDHAHPELSTPECADARSLVVYDRAAELIAVRSMSAARLLLPEGEEIVVYKNNSDGKGNSYGCHENYLMSRAVPFSRIVANATAHFVTRQIFCGAGKIGTEAAGMRVDDAGYQLSQRADFIEEEVGLETTLKRPIVNTRDEPHADAAKYRRLHVIVGDANMSQVATFLKVGTTAVVMALTEDAAAGRELRFASPVAALRQVSRDLSLRAPLELEDGSTITALEVQWELLAAARAYVDARGSDAVGGEATQTVLSRWETVLENLQQDPSKLAGQIDWIAKLRLLEAFRERHSLAWSDARLRALDIQYHDLRPDKSLAARAGLETLVDEAEALRAVSEPPHDTRAFFRGRCLQKFAAEVAAANWDSIVFDVGEGSLRRVSMAEPNRGTVDHVGAMFEDCDSAVELLRRLGSADA
ncbi:MAG: depupylase/deamidase Dop [Acidimicrobiaceae bacterium]|nr:depupylase/deamidase Dop [Acidimicrobiaceae bacterium]MCY4176110.1 depupylase/deamidase Dop [Acidimicrobiaceae bacterium]MCY4279687.1 depupylase/deamidase Dop [Acidimicrobiaceae bacterium]